MNPTCRAKPEAPARHKPPAPTPEAIPLCALGPGQKARIVGIVGDGDEVLRLNEFGLRPGVEIQMLRPGQTSIFRLGATKVCFRPSPGLSVLVRPDSH